jgi:hypothetical protein
MPRSSLHVLYISGPFPSNDSSAVFGTVVGATDNVKHRGFHAGLVMYASASVRGLYYSYSVGCLAMQKEGLKCCFSDSTYFLVTDYFFRRGLTALFPLEYSQNNPLLAFPRHPSAEKLTTPNVNTH